MSDTAVFVLGQHARAIPLLAHLEELRRRIIFSVVGELVGFLSCWSFADRILRLMPQPILQALRDHGCSSGLVYLNPTGPFNAELSWCWVSGRLTTSPCVV